MFRKFFFIMAIGLVSSTLEAQTGSATNTRESSATYTYEGYIALGHGKYIAGDYPGAISKYEEAKSKEPGRADAYYYIGCSMMKQNRYEEAATVLSSAATIAAEKNPSIHAKALFNVARVWELAGNMKKCKFAWAKYKEYAQAHPNANVFVDVAEQKVAAIEAFEQKKKEYQIVLDRAAANQEN